MSNEYYNGLKHSLARRYRGLSVGQKERFKKIEALSRKLRDNNFVLGMDKEIFKVSNGGARPVEKEFLEKLVRELDPLVIEEVGAFDLEILKSELYFIPGITIINKEIPEDPLTDIPRFVLKVKAHNKKCERIPVTDSRTADINKLIANDFFISGDNLYRFDNLVLGSYGAFDKKNRIILYKEMGEREVIIISPAMEETIRDTLMSVPDDNVKLVFEENKRAKELEEKKKLLSLFY